MSLEVFNRVMNDIINDFDQIVTIHNELSVNVELIPQSKLYEIKCILNMLYSNVNRCPDKLIQYHNFLDSSHTAVNSLFEYSKEIGGKFEESIVNLIKKIKHYLG